MNDYPVYTCGRCGNQVVFSGQIGTQGDSFTHQRSYVMLYCCIAFPEEHYYHIPCTPESDPNYDQHQPFTPSRPPFPGGR